LTAATCTDDIFQGLPCQRLCLPNGDSARVTLFGAQVLSWQAAGRERLYLSPRNRWDGHSAIRGGIPVCFPQFNQRGPLPKHGLARRSHWQPTEVQTEAERVTLTLQWQDDDATRAVWPQRFVAQLQVCLAVGQLQVVLQLDNPDTQPLRFTGALHTYLAVTDIAQASLQGLAGQAEWDAVSDRHGLAAERLRFAGEFDRVYAAAPGPLRLDDGGQCLHITQSDSWAQQVVWNPGADQCAALPDMPADGYRHMLCVEAAQVYTPITVPAGAQWRGWQLFSLA
jgi:glucose-6-phosphate 1-epimerase